MGTCGATPPPPPIDLKTYIESWLEVIKLEKERQLAVWCQRCEEDHEYDLVAGPPEWGLGRARPPHIDDMPVILWMKPLEPEPPWNGMTKLTEWVW